MIDKIHDWWKEQKRERKRPLCISIIIIIIVIVPVLILLFHPAIVVEPQKLDVSISPGNSTVKTISIGVIGIGDRGVTLSAVGPIVSWVKFSKNNENFKNNITVEIDKTQYINVNLSLQSNITPGDYRGAIEISHKRGKTEIPVLVKIEG